MDVIYTRSKKMATDVAIDKAKKSRMAWLEAIVVADKALARAKKQNTVVDKAVVKAQKLRQCYELDEAKVKALEELR